MFRDEGRFAFALAALDRHDFSAAESELTALLARDPPPSELAYLFNKRGVARMGLNLRERAREDFTAALEVAPRHAPALTNLGNLLLEEGRLDAAIVHYESAIAADPEYALAYMNASVAYKRSGRLADAVRALRRSQRLESRANVRRSWPARRW